MPTLDNDGMFLRNLSDGLQHKVNWQNIQYNALYVVSAAFQTAVKEHQQAL